MSLAGSHWLSLKWRLCSSNYGNWELTGTILCPVPETIHDDWMQWRSELNLLTTKHIPQCYFSKTTTITSTELHGFSNTSERAYATVVYLQMTDTDGNTQVSIKKLIPRLELYGTPLLPQLLYHVKVFELPIAQVFAWTDSTIVLSWLVGNPTWFKTYVVNRVSGVIELIGPDRWSHVNGAENPADCASRGIFPSELLEHQLWWYCPEWLRLPPRPQQSELPLNKTLKEEKQISFHTVTQEVATIIPADRFLCYTRLKYVTAWIFLFLNNCRSHKNSSPHLTTTEIQVAETYWVSVIQRDHFTKEIQAIKDNRALHDSSALFIVSSSYPWLFWCTPHWLEIKQLKNVIFCSTSSHSPWKTSCD